MKSAQDEEAEDIKKLEMQRFEDKAAKGV